VQFSKIEFISASTNDYNVGFIPLSPRSADSQEFPFAVSPQFLDKSSAHVGVLAVRTCKKELNKCCLQHLQRFAETGRQKLQRFCKMLCKKICGAYASYFRIRMRDVISSRDTTYVTRRDWLRR